jgi:hypothetical protein
VLVDEAGAPFVFNAEPWMRPTRSPFARIGAVLFGAAIGLAVDGSVISAQLPMEPIKNAGQSITPAYEGWYRTPDGTKALLVGYFNRNMKETLDIPVGPNNRIEPGGPDMGQPTHFTPRRQWGVFSIVLPDDFGDKKLTWTIVANGITQSVPMGLHVDYVVEPYRETGMGNTPPVLKFEVNGKGFSGPPLGVAATITATVNTPTELNLWAGDDGIDDPRFPTQPGGVKPLNVAWAVHRQPAGATVKFTEEKPKVNREAEGKATTSATFSMPGEYLLRAQGNDLSGEGGGGFQCCWTNAIVKVNVR